MRHAEQIIQMQIVAWIRLQFPNLLFTISPGGLLTSAKVGGKAKKLGYTAGTPDLLIFEPVGNYKGLFIELKTDTGVTSTAQHNFLTELNKRGYFARVCYDYFEATEKIKNYLENKLLQVQPFKK